MRQRLAADPDPIDYKTGRLKSGAKLGPLWLRARRSSGSLGPVVDDDPCTTGSTDLEDYYMFHQEFAVFHPCVTHPQFRQPGDLKCPKCLQAGVLQGNGLRQGTTTVLLLDGQQKVFSQGMTHTNCRGHNGKDYTFSSWDLTWLEVNFKPALLTALPYIILPGNTVVSRSLLEFINSLRVNGMSFEAIVKSRNKTHKAVRLLKLCLQFQADKVAAQRLTPFGRAGSMAAAGPAPVPAQGPTAPGSSGQLGASSSSSGRQAGSRQPPAPKQSTLQSIWGRAGQLLQTLSPSKGSRANQEPSTEQQPQQQQGEEPEQQQQQQCSSRGVQQPLADTQQPSTAEQEGSQQSGLRG